MSPIVEFFLGNKKYLFIYTIKHFLQRGFRTLVIGYKKLDSLDYEKFMRNVENAREKIGDTREHDISEAYECFEKGLTLLGVTAVEDRLQDDVSQTMESLKAAHIKVRILQFHFYLFILSNKQFIQKIKNYFLFL